MNKKRMPAAIFDEMMNQVKLLITLKGGCSEEEIRKQFRNVKSDIVMEFIMEAKKRGILKENNGTFTLKQLEVSQ